MYPYMHVVQSYQGKESIAEMDSTVGASFLGVSAFCRSQLWVLHMSGSTGRKAALWPWLPHAALWSFQCRWLVDGREDSGEAAEHSMVVTRGRRRGR